MDYEFDATKNASNIAKHGVNMSIAEGFDWGSAMVGADHRADYGEDRFIAVGYIDAQLYVMVHTMRGEAVRIISLRKANKREVKYYDES